MIKTFILQPGVVLRCFPDTRFKHASLSIQLVRCMGQEEAYNALLPAVLLRGTEKYPDMGHIIRRLDDLYGASAGASVRRIGNCQTTGLRCSFIEDRFAMEGDQVVRPMAEFMGQLLLRPVLEDGCFRKDYVESEKENLIQTIQAQRNDKRAYAAAQLLRAMGKEDSFGIPRLGNEEDVTAITPKNLYDHYQKILRESPVEIFYTGSVDPEEMAKILTPLFADIPRRDVAALPAQTPLRSAPGGDITEQMELTQGKLAIGYVTPVTVFDSRFVAMQVFNTLFGSGMVSKLFMKIREEMSLCYDINSGYYGSKGVLTVSAGIDFDKVDLVRREIENQLEDCRKGKITREELIAAKESVISGLEAVHDSPGSIEGYYAVAALSGLTLTPEEYIRQVRLVTPEQVAAVAKTLTLHTTYFLQGVE